MAGEVVGAPPPDGGWGWLVALGAALVQMQVERSMADVSPEFANLVLPLNLKSNSCDAVCNPGHNFWGLFCPPDQPGRAGGGAAARRPRLLRPLHHGLHHVLLLPNLHRPLKGVELCSNFFPGNKLLRSAPSNLWESFSKASSLHFAGRQN